MRRETRAVHVISKRQLAFAVPRAPIDDSIEIFDSTVRGLRTPPIMRERVWSEHHQSELKPCGIIAVVSLDRASNPAPGWFIDELSYAGRENLDAGHVARYDAKEDASAASEVALLEGVGLTRESLVLEFGAGTGQFSVEVAPACARVIAVDVSGLMLDQLQTKVADLGLGNVETVRAGFLTYEHAGGPVDFIYSRYALHHLPDFWKAVALSRLRRMLDPGGVLRLWDVVYDFAPAEAEDRIETWCATGGDTVEAEWSRAELEEHVRDEHSTFSWILEPIILRSGFEIAQAEHSEDRIFAKYLLRAV
jgi:SAM-dependent methyltransferase